MPARLFTAASPARLLVLSLTLLPLAAPSKAVSSETTLAAVPDISAPSSEPAEPAAAAVEPENIMPSPAPQTAPVAPKANPEGSPPMVDIRKGTADPLPGAGGLASLFGDPEASAARKRFSGRAAKPEETDPDVKKALREALDYYVKACASGDATACLSAGLFHAAGQGVTEKDYFKARDFYQSGCQMGNTLACKTIGAMYENGAGLRQHYGKAREFYDYACSSGLGAGCDALGALYEKGRGLPRNFAKAKELYGKACDLENQDGCESFKRLNQ